MTNTYKYTGIDTIGQLFDEDRPSYYGDTEPRCTYFAERHCFASNLNEGCALRP